ncbi:helix-turn-helix domain-containing GNAT family N-acetyltransferase [Euzebya tangerina]|uniref:helix-turn-helix domain-containing GNAT family N-acetyltransferase n=1 Tax=Euzebya tangerina TaxID=591198 RepID=UPI000E3235A1|nr:metalloregulator ArsR/SmtB family transcription factor [Euzebya tangerina]
MTATLPTVATSGLSEDAASTYAAWFATLSDPTRVRVLHAVASSTEELPIGTIAERVGIAQPTASHHIKLLADAGFVELRKVGTSTQVRVNEACCTGLPHAADAVMGTLDTLPCCPEDVQEDVAVRAMTDADLQAVADIYVQGIATRNATFTTEAPTPDALAAKWHRDHRWVAEVEGTIAGWAALTPVSDRACYAGVAETQIYVDEQFRGRRVGVALIDRLVNAADEAGLWTLQAQIFPENRASIRLHRSSGFRIVGMRERIGKLDGVWRDTVLMERRR